MHRVQGSARENVTVITSDDSPYAVTATDRIVVFSGSAALTCNLPAVSANDGRLLGLFHDGGAFTATINGNGSDTVLGSESVDLTDEGGIKVQAINGDSDWRGVGALPAGA